MDRPVVGHETLAGRIREVRRERYGDEGIAALATELDLPGATWRIFEAGVVMPATVLLRFLVATGVNPYWLLTGQGRRYL
jgi:hypothetical protein